jgi:hypothetical protein
MEQQEVIHQGTEEDDQEARLRPEILFDLDAEQSKQASILEQEREKHRRRSVRCGQMLQTCNNHNPTAQQPADSTTGV